MTVGYAPKRTVCSSELTVEKMGEDSDGFGIEKVQTCKTHIKTFEVFADFEHKLFRTFCALRQGRFWRVGLG